MNLDLGDTRLILEECRSRGVLRNQAAYILATAKWETAHTMRPIKERGSSDYLRSKPYWPFIGHGYVQLTWEKNFAKASEEVGVDLVADPGRALEPHIAAEVLVAGMMDGWFTGRRLGQYVTLHRSDFKGARRVVNGRDRAAEIAAIAREYDAKLKSEGYGEDAAPPAATPFPPQATPTQQEPNMPGQGEYLARIALLILTGGGFGAMIAGAIPGVDWITVDGTDGFFVDPEELLNLVLPLLPFGAWFALKRRADRLGGKT